MNTLPSASLILVYIFTQASLATLSEKAKPASEISVPVV